MIRQFFQNFKGIDLRTSDLLREAGAATEIKNATLRRSGSLSKKKGHKVSVGDGGGLGTTSFFNISSTTGIPSEELITVGSSLYKKTDATITITYSGSATAYYEMYVDETDSVFYFDLYDDNTRVLHYDLGTGYEASPVTISNLETNIDATANFASVVSAGGSSPAAFALLPKLVGTIATAPGTAVAFSYLSVITSPGTYTPFTTFYANRNTEAFENASFASLNNILYIATGADALAKYDGQRCYRAGMTVGAFTSVTAVAGAVAAGTYKWIITYEHVDAKEGVVEGVESDLKTLTTGGVQSFDLVIPTLQPSSGYVTDQAVVNGLQAGVTTITVDAGHKIKVGDSVYFYDGVSASYVTRTVSAIAATTITISGANVNVADNAVISQNLKINIYRTKTTGSIYYLVASVPNDSLNSSITFNDNLADTALGAEYVTPVKPHTTPPIARYVDVWRGQLICTGIADSVNTVAYSDSEGNEYFPTDNTFLTESPRGDKNSGLRALDNALYVFKKESIMVITGDLPSASIQVDIASRQGVGCESHASIAEVGGRLWFMSQWGIYSIGPEGLKEESANIKQTFELADATYSYQRSVGFFWNDENKYILFIPVETTDGSNNVYATSDSKIFIYDTYWGAWLEWSSMPFAGGIAEHMGSLYFCQRRNNPITTNASYAMCQVLNTGDETDYADHTDPIEFVYKTHWESLQTPTVFKKFLRLKIFSLDISVNDFETNDFTIDVTTEHDYGTETISSLSYDFSGGAGGWGESAWGDFPWGEGRLPAVWKKLKSRKAKSVRTIFENDTLYENIMISGYEMEIETPYKEAIKE